MNETKNHIIKTSLRLFLQKSYKEVTMNEIVKEIGLSKGAFYHHFAGKEELFKEIANLFFSSGVIDYSSFPNQSLKEFYIFYIQYMTVAFSKMYELVGVSEDEKVSANFFLIMFEAIGRFPEFLKIEQKQYNINVEAWEQVIGHAKEAGEIKSESTARQIADLFLYCTDGVFIRFVNNDKSISYDTDLQIAFDTIYNNLKA